MPLKTTSLMRYRIYNRCVSHPAARSSFGPISIAQYSMTKSSTNTKAMLQSFPEYNEAINLINENKLLKAIPLIERVSEVVAHALGEASPLTAYTNTFLAQTHIQHGNIQTGRNILKKNMESSNIDSRSRVVAMQLLSGLDMRLGDVASSQAIANQSVDFLENHKSSDIDVDLFHASYGLQGINQLLLTGDVDNAEGILQTAARWSQNEMDELVGLNNLGALHWFKLTERQKWRHNQFNSSEAITSGNDLSRKDLRQSAEEYTNEAVGYWEECIANANKPWTFEEPVPVTACAIPGESSSSNASRPDILQNRLQNIEYARAYSSVLCNLAEAYESLGENDKCSEAIASALSSLDLHKHNTLVQPELARVLTLAAYSQMHKKLAVSAEGLFRSAMDKFALVKNDKRHLYESAIATGGYGRLLTLWDKREQHGRESVARAGREIAELSSHGTQQIFLSQTILLPRTPDIL